MDVLIAGGGTAGQIAALTISRVRPDIDVTVISSSDIGTISAGEGSTYLFTEFLSGAGFYTGIDVEDFYHKTDATYKTGIKHVGWTDKNEEYFAPLGGSSTHKIIPDTEFLRVLSHTDDKFHVASVGGRAYERDIVSESHSFHFDSIKIGEYISNIARQSGVQYVDATISDVHTEHGKIVSVDTTDGETFSADFFIDATGFSRVLMNSLSNSWVSYKQHLPVDSALSFQLPHNGDFEPVTTATAMNAGWMWRIPTSKRFGCGYVYCSEYIDSDAAKNEIYNTVGSVDISREYSFNSGRLESVWLGNCLAVGLAASFVEPLEATSIHTLIIQITKFVFNHLKGEDTTVKPTSIRRYNRSTNKLYDDIRDFLIVHYKGGRDDSQFWKYMNSDATNTPQVNYILDVCEDGVPTLYDIDNYIGSPGIMLWNWVLAGTGNIDSGKAKQELNRFGL